MMQINKKYIKIRFWKLYSRFISYVLFEGRPLTTKGRWINPFVFFTYKICTIVPFKKKISKPIFILGTGRSGTTILGIVLSMHKDVSFLNEPKALWSFINPNEDLIGSYNLNDATYYKDESDITQDQITKIHKILNFYLKISFSTRVVDKYPELIFRISYVKSLFPDAKFLFLVRNGWDTCHSINNWSKRLSTSTENETQDWWGINNRKWKLLCENVIKKDNYFKPLFPFLDQIDSHTDMAAVEWIATMRQGLLMLEEYPNDILRVNYEELIASPTEILNEIVKFSELIEDKIFVNYGKEVLTPVRAKPPFDMHPSINSLFIDTMNELGY